jgi:hypothetical protein
VRVALHAVAMGLPMASTAPRCAPARLAMASATASPGPKAQEGEI